MCFTQTDHITFYLFYSNCRYFSGFLFMGLGQLFRRGLTFLVSFVHQRTWLLILARRIFCSLVFPFFLF
eukprot:UN14411